MVCFVSALNGSSTNLAWLVFFIIYLLNSPIEILDLTGNNIHLYARVYAHAKANLHNQIQTILYHKQKIYRNVKCIRMRRF